MSRPRYDSLLNRTVPCAFCGRVKVMSSMVDIYSVKVRRKGMRGRPLFCNHRCANEYRKKHAGDEGTAETVKRAGLTPIGQITDIRATAPKMSLETSDGAAVPDNAAVKCPYCGVAFKPRRKSHKFCSYVCSWRYRNGLNSRLRRPDAEPRRVVRGTARAAATPRRLMPNVESLVDVPCFKMECLGVNNCHPETCVKLDEWLKVTDEGRKAKPMNDPSGDSSRVDLGGHVEAFPAFPSRGHANLCVY